MGELTNIDGAKPKGKGSSKPKLSTPKQGSEGQGATNTPPIRTTTYTEEIGLHICAQLAEGRSLRSILREDDSLPAMSTVFKWLSDIDAFSEQYARAKAESADALADDIQEIAEKTLKGTYDPQSARVAMDGKKWVASKLKPKVYGDKLDLTTGNEKLNRGMSDAELNAILERAAKGSTANKAGTGTQTR